MNFLRRSFVVKTFIFLLFLGGILAGGLFAVKRFFGIQALAPMTLLWASVALFAVLIFFFWWSVSRPLRLVLQQMQALILGKSYKKIYTDRVDEVGILAHFFNEMTKHLHTFSTQIKEGERMASELEVASNIQRGILPLQAPRVPGLVIAAKTRPAAEVGGDSFDFLTVGDKTFLYIGDATGHGVPAGIVMTIVNTLVYAYAEIATSLKDMMVHVNRHLKRRIQKTLFMSMVMLQWDHTEQIMRFVGAGHEYLLVYRMKTGKVDAIPSGGVALGMSPDISGVIQEAVLPFEDGDMLVLYTDGINECKNVAGELYGLDRLKDGIAKFASQYAPELVLRKIAGELGAFMGQHQPDDDMTIIVVQRASATTAAAVTDEQLKTEWT